MNEHEKPDAPTFESAYDPDSSLRVIRLAGVFEVEWLTEVAIHDPTIEFLPDCPTLLDLRSARPNGGPGDVARLAARMAGEGKPREFERYAWLFDRTDNVGMAMLYQGSTGAGGKLHWFTELDDALDHLGVTREDFDRTRGTLRPIEPSPEEN